MSIDQLDRLVSIVKKNGNGKFSADHVSRATAVEAIASYGEAAIPALLQISEEADLPYIKQKALDSIAKIKANRIP